MLCKKLSIATLFSVVIIASLALIFSNCCSPRVIGHASVPSLVKTHLITKSILPAFDPPKINATVQEAAHRNANDEENVKFTKRFVYLVQTESCLPGHLADSSALGNSTNCQCDVVVLSYKTKCSSHLPHVKYIFNSTSTWSSGRGELYMALVQEGVPYMYYIFMDDDVILKGRNEESKRNPWRFFENFLLRVQPPMAAVDTSDWQFVDRIFKLRQHHKCVIKQTNTMDYIPAVWYDGIFNAFYHEAVETVLKPLLPLWGKYDKISWWFAQWYICILSDIVYHYHVVHNVKLMNKNPSHRPYVRKRCDPEQIKSILADIRTVILTQLVKSADILLQIWRDQYKQKRQDARNNDGETPFDVAIRKNHTSVVECLRSNTNLQPKDPLSAHPSLWHLYQLEVDDIWFNLGLQLGLHEDELTAMERENKYSDECKLSMFHALKLKIPEFRVGQLLKALLNGGRGHTLFIVAAKFGWLDLLKHLSDVEKLDPNGIMSESGQTPLSLACTNGHTEIVKYLLDEHRCDPKIVVNEVGRIPFHSKCTRGDDHLDMINALDDKKVHPDGKVTKSEQTLLSLACANGHTEIVKYLIEVHLCDPRREVNKSGQTPLSLAYANRHKEIVKYLVDVHHCDPRFIVSKDGDMPFHLECARGDLEMIKSLDDKIDNLDGLMSESGQTPLSLACANGHTEVVKYLVDVNHCDPRSIVNKSGQTPLSLAYTKRHKKIIKYLVDVHHCDPSFSVNESGETPFHLECAWGNLDMIKCLDDKKVNLDDCLLISCKHNQGNIVDYLLNDRQCDPNVLNKKGQTPLDLTTDNKIIHSLLKHGAQAADVYKRYRKILGEISAQHIPQNPLTILITGDSGTGKSSFLKAFTKKISILQQLGVRKGRPVTGVDEKTVGIIPYLYETKRFGRVLLYDFAGQKEFFTSHSAILQNAVQTCPPIIVFCCNLQDSEEEITTSATYWMNLIQNQCSALQGRAHVVVVGSHADLLLGRGENSRSKDGIFSPIIAKFPKFKFLAFVPMDCRLPDSEEMKEIEVAVPLRVIREKFQVDLKQAHPQSELAVDQGKKFGAKTQTKKDLLSFIPNTLPRVIEICSQLSKKGHILFLLNKSTPENSYVICDQQTLLSEITGTVYAPEGFRQHCKLASSTGVVPLVKFHNHFKQHDLDMLLAFMSHLEFCFEVKDEQVLMYISTQQLESPDSASAAAHLSNRYLFFPGLIKIDFPERVWESHAGMKFHFGWILYCSQEVQFFDSRCLHVLVLRLVFLFNLAPAKAVQCLVPSLQRFCSVWKNGICWCNDDGITCLVELVEHSKALTVQIRCQELAPECLEFRGRVVSKVLETAQQVCPNLETIESVILPAEVETHPLSTISQLSLFEIHDMASAVVHTKKTVKSMYKATSLSSLLQFEPFACLNRKSLSFLLHPHNSSSAKISNSFIFHLASQVHDSNDKKMLEKIFTLDRACSSQGLSHTLEMWRNETEGTYQCLRDTLESYSIFGRRNPLDLAGVPPGDWDPVIFADIEEPELILESQHQLQPDLMSDIDLDSVEESTRLGDDDVADILKELSGMESEFDMLALNLHLPLGTVNTIKRDYHFSSKSALGQVIIEWVLMNYNHTRFGAPSWRLLVAAVDTLDHKRAKQIASRYQKVCQTVTLPP